MKYENPDDWAFDPWPTSEPASSFHPWLSLQEALIGEPTDVNPWPCVEPAASEPVAFFDPWLSTRLPASGNGLLVWGLDHPWSPDPTASPDGMLPIPTSSMSSPNNQPNQPSGYGYETTAPADGQPRKPTESNPKEELGTLGDVNEVVKSLGEVAGRGKLAKKLGRIGNWVIQPVTIANDVLQASDSGERWIRGIGGAISWSASALAGIIGTGLGGPLVGAGASIGATHAVDSATDKAVENHLEDQRSAAYWRSLGYQIPEGADGLVGAIIMQNAAADLLYESETGQHYLDD